ncbi:hypothetical protein C1X94_26675 [Pseudomonas sp. FW306-02-H05-AB]|nr:hypothetical protein C1X94_26675 [Pseudomonas sp. FW306-02-H05-AB]
MLIFPGLVKTDPLLIGGFALGVLLSGRLMFGELSFTGITQLYHEPYRRNILIQLQRHEHSSRLAR